MKPCDGNHAPLRSGPWAPDQCRVCWLYQNDPGYRALWDATGPAVSQPRRLPCIFLGAVIDRRDCPCPGRWLRACAVHGVCCIEECKTCNDHHAE
jgi:hypothetical protein